MLTWQFAQLKRAKFISLNQFCYLERLNEQTFIELTNKWQNVNKLINHQTSLSSYLKL